MSVGSTASGVQQEFAEDIRAALAYYFSLASFDMSTGPKYENMFSLLFLTYLQYVQDEIKAAGGGRIKEGMEFAFDLLSSMRGSRGYDEFVEFLTESDLYLENTIWFAEKYNKFDLLEDLLDKQNPYRNISFGDTTATGPGTAQDGKAYAPTLFNRGS